MSDYTLLRSPQGHQVVDCSANPFDVRPYVNAIMDRANFLYRENGKPVVILMGEAHDRGTHIAALQLAVQQARKILSHDDSKVSVGLEIPHNELAQALSVRGVDLRTVSRVKKGIAFSQFSGAGFDASGMSPRFGANFFSSLDLDPFEETEKPSISVFLNDVARKKNDYGAEVLDCDDAMTNFAVQCYARNPSFSDFIKLGAGIDARSKLGMIIRNKTIYSYVLGDLQESQAQLHIQQTGMMHVKGGVTVHNGKPTLNNYYDSLESLLADNDQVNVISAMADEDVFAKIAPSEFIPPSNLSNTFTARGLNQQAFYSGRSQWLPSKNERLAMWRIRRATQGEYAIHI